MSRCRHRIHYNELRRIGMESLPRDKLSVAWRWESVCKWPDGSTIGIDKREDAALQFTYRAGDAECSFRVPLAFSPRRFGGAQAYLVCPRCWQRCRVLRFVRAGLRCRRCIGAIYVSQSVAPADRALYRFRKLRARIRSGTEDFGLSYFPRRLKGMRRVTYARIKANAMAALDRYHGALDVGLYRWLARVQPELVAEILR